MEAAAPEPCDNCDGRGWWSGECDGQIDCFQCHGTGVLRARGNCDMCLGWGWSIRAEQCKHCNGTGWVTASVALFWCNTCSRTVSADEAAPACPNGGPGHAIERVTVAIKPPPTV